MINKVILIGNLGADPEQRFTQAGVAMSTFNVATSERWKGQDGQMQEQTEWHRIIAWRQLAEICNEYLHKGSRVYIEGKLQTRKWQDQNGNDRYTTEIVAREMKMLSPRGESGGSGGSGGDYDPGPEPPSGGGGYDDFAGGSQTGGGTGSDVPF
ncbi:single-strand binding protein [Candidatus Electrothrix marina]|uniref:Single-stranded DNA-binding protein n=1 Tax=Candidatus Electrothrix marina TaxID=1859130 RepID=A0A3S3QPJ8_9BACT|nr:single-strand binding protein [Candidatus Electrothrix marina]